MIGVSTKPTEVFVSPFKLDRAQRSTDQLYESESRMGYCDGSVPLRVETCKTSSHLRSGRTGSFSSTKVSRFFGRVTGTGPSLWGWRYVKSFHFPDLIEFGLSVRHKVNRFSGELLGWTIPLKIETCKVSTFPRSGKVVVGRGGRTRPSSLSMTWVVFPLRCSPTRGG